MKLLSRLIASASRPASLLAFEEEKRHSQKASDSPCPLPEQPSATESLDQGKEDSVRPWIDLDNKVTKYAGANTVRQTDRVFLNNLFRYDKYFPALLSKNTFR